MDDLKKKWDAFKARPFPDELAGEDIQDVCITSLDTYVAGCIDSYITGKTLGYEKTIILQKCLQDIKKNHSFFCNERIERRLQKDISSSSYRCL